MTVYKLFRYIFVLQFDFVLFDSFRIFLLYYRSGTIVGSSSWPLSRGDDL